VIEESIEAELLRRVERPIDVDASVARTRLLAADPEGAWLGRHSWLLSLGSAGLMQQT
jgi:hypothetical protein